MRKARGMSSVELARVADVSPNTLYKVENVEGIEFSGSTIMRIYRALKMAGKLSDEEWATFRDSFGLADSVRVDHDAVPKPPNERGAATSAAVQFAMFLRTLDPTRAAAMQLVFEMIDRAGADKVVETLEAMKRMLTVTAAPGTLIHRRESVQDGYRVTELSPHKVEPAKADAKPKAKKIGG